MTLGVDEVVSILRSRGPKQYGGEAVTQLEHALQCADLAERAGENEATIVAALLHDFGHLLNTNHLPTAAGIRPPPPPDDRHQYTALPFLKGLFPEAVLAPIGLHVDAKRYLCSVQPGYHESLSPASMASLKLQGGSFSAEEAQTFMRLRFASEAVRVRIYDDQAKTAGRITPTLEYFEPLLAKVACQGRSGRFDWPTTRP